MQADTTTFALLMVWTSVLVLAFGDNILKLLLLRTSNKNLVSVVIASNFVLYLFMLAQQHGKMADIAIGIYSGIVSSLFASIFVYRFTKYLDIKNRTTLSKNILTHMYPIIEHNYSTLIFATKNILTPITVDRELSSSYSFKDIEFVFKPSLLTIREIGEDSYHLYFDTLNAFTTVVSTLVGKLDPEICPEVSQKAYELISLSNLNSKNVQSTIHSIKHGNHQVYEIILKMVRETTDQDPHYFQHANIMNGMIMTYQFVRSIYETATQLTLYWQKYIETTEIVEPLHFAKRPNGIV